MELKKAVEISRGLLKAGEGFYDDEAIKVLIESAKEILSLEESGAVVEKKVCDRHNNASDTPKKFCMNCLTIDSYDICRSTQILLMVRNRVSVENITKIMINMYHANQKEKHGVRKSSLEMIEEYAEALYELIYPKMYLEDGALMARNRELVGRIASIAYDVLKEYMKSNLAKHQDRHDIGWAIEKAIHELIYPKPTEDYGLNPEGVFIDEAAEIPQEVWDKIETKPEGK